MIADKIADKIVDYNGQPTAVKDIPNRAIRWMLGMGHDTRDRVVIDVPGRTWETTPDVCEYGDRDWTWVAVNGPTDTYLVCPKCGLDGT